MLRQTFQRLVVQACKLCRDIEIECRDIMQGKRQKLCHNTSSVVQDRKLCRGIRNLCRDKNSRRRPGRNIATKPQQSQSQGKRLLCRDINQLCHEKDAWKEKQVNVETNSKQS